jgi:hypothetical protein
LRWLQVQLEVNYNWHDDLVCYPLIANLHFGGFASLAVRLTLDILLDRDWWDNSAFSVAKSS